MKTWKAGTRGSDLALYQTRFVISELKKSGIEAQESIITTKGDVDQRPFTQIAGDGYFTKELERALHDRSTDLAIHSAKDLPSLVHKDLPWVAFGKREESHDILITRPDFVESSEPLILRKGMRVGTSSPRRRHQLQDSQPQVQAVELRGNVPTRIKKVADGLLDAVVLAKAGVKRLGLLEKLEAQGLIAIDLDWIASPCQGIIAVQTREELSKNLTENKELNDIAKAEKSLLALLGGGCHLPLGAQIQKRGKEYELSVFLGEDSSSFSGQFRAPRLGDTVRQFIHHFVSAQKSSRVWLTQPIQHVLKPAHYLAKSNFEPVVWPLTEIASSWDLKNIMAFLEMRNSFGAVAFSSQFAVQIFMIEMAQHFDVLDWINSKVVFSVGPSTTETLKNYGVRDVISSKEAHAKSLSRTIENAEFRGKLLVPGQAGAFLKKNLGLGPEGYQGLELYKVRPSTSALAQDIPEIHKDDRLIVTSPSAAREFVLWCKRHAALKRLQVWAFGPSTSRELSFLGVDHKTNPVSGSWEALIRAL